MKEILRVRGSSPKAAHQRQRHPVRGVLEARHVEHEHAVGAGVVAAHRRVVAVAGLAQPAPPGGGGRKRVSRPLP